mmetsp:Transcript_32213/g.96912  ORF Transcript_32213/g.96912 Transcript_32213/m.96912 type:complete len:781 (-) Transcript_32213:2228-4570(-)
MHIDTPLGGAVKALSLAERRQLERLPKSAETEAARVNRIHRQLNALNRKHLSVFFKTKLKDVKAEKSNCVHDIPCAAETCLQVSWGHQPLNARRSRHSKTRLARRRYLLPAQFSSRMPLARHEVRPKHHTGSSLSEIEILRSHLAVSREPNTVTRVTLDRKGRIQNLVEMSAKWLVLCALRRHVVKWKLVSSSPNLKCKIIQQAARQQAACVEMRKRIKLRSLQAKCKQRCLGQVITIREVYIKLTQKLVRGRLSRTASRQHIFAAAALRILQLAARSRTASLTLVRLRRKHAEMVSGLVLIQYCWRRHRVRKRFALKKATLHVDRVIDFHRKRAVAQRHGFRILGAVILIQKHWQRRLVIRENHFRAEYMREKNCNIIRRCVLNFLVLARHRRRGVVDMNAMRAKSVIAIWSQTHHRRRAAIQTANQLRLDAHIHATALRKYRSTKLEASQIYLTENGESTTKTPKSFARQWWLSAARAYRHLLTSSTAPRTTHALLGRYDRVISALEVTSAFRAHSCASRVRVTLLHQRLCMQAVQSNVLEQNTRLIQQLARGWLTRLQKLKNIHSRSSMKMQKMVRGSLGRRQILRVRARFAAALCIQTVARNKLLDCARGPCQIWLQRLQSPAKIIQRRCRARKSIRVVNKLRKVAICRDESMLGARVRLEYCRKITAAELCAESYVSCTNYCGEFQAVFAKYCRMDDGVIFQVLLANKMNQVHAQLRANQARIKILVHASFVRHGKKTATGQKWPRPNLSVFSETRQELSVGLIEFHPRDLFTKV